MFLEQVFPTRPKKHTRESRQKFRLSSKRLVDTRMVDMPVRLLNQFHALQVRAWTSSFNRELDVILSNYGLTGRKKAEVVHVQTDSEQLQKPLAVQEVSKRIKIRKIYEPLQTFVIPGGWTVNKMCNFV